jgi:hypothetical protein
MTWLDGVVIALLIAGALIGFLASRREDMADRAIAYFLVVFLAHFLAVSAAAIIMDVRGDWEMRQYCVGYRQWLASFNYSGDYSEALNSAGCSDILGLLTVGVFIFFVILFVLRYRRANLLGMAASGFTWHVSDWLNRCGSIILAALTAWIFCSIILNSFFSRDTALWPAATAFLINLDSWPGYIVIAIVIGVFVGLIFQGKLSERRSSLPDEVLPPEVESFSLHQYYERKAREEQDRQAQSHAEPDEGPDHPSGVF